MPSNIEIKVRIDDLPTFEARARALCGEPASVIRQEDVFFPSPTGRLKLRIIDNANGELIYYERRNESGPKLSDYRIAATDCPLALRDTLMAAYGALTTVRKLRRVYLAGRTRIHLDSVDTLGDFLELEVVLADNESPAAAESEAESLMDRLQIDRQQLVDCAYADLQLREFGRLSS